MKQPEQTENAEVTEPGIEPGTNHTSDNESGPAIPEENQTVAIKPSGSQVLGDRKAKGPKGPRTELGKQTASRNATKHGVFSQAVVLPGESRDEFEGLRARLREALQPEGALEELLVEKLATIAWRHRRLLLAESAEFEGTRSLSSRISGIESAKRLKRWEMGPILRTNMI